MEISPFTTGETEVEAQAIFIIDDANQGVVRPMPLPENTGVARAVAITTQLERDHHLALQLSGNTQPREDLRLSEDFQPNNDWAMMSHFNPMEIENSAPSTVTQTHTTSGFDVMEDDSFDMIEFIASSRIRQCLTFNTCLVIIYFILLVAMIATGGFATQAENPIIGPPVTTLIKFQAKQASLMVYKNQWLRIIFSMFLHSGIFHFLPIALIQLRVGGYLNLVFGTPVYMGIAAVSGIFGNMLGCCASPSSVAVGSQGALMGLLMAWLTYVFFRWPHIDDRFHKARNRQVLVALGCILILFVMSFEPFIDFVTIIGGAIQVLRPALYVCVIDDLMTLSYNIHMHTYTNQLNS